jgi:hypothetical protein
MSLIYLEDSIRFNNFTRELLIILDTLQEEINNQSSTLEYVNKTVKEI